MLSEVDGRGETGEAASNDDRFPLRHHFHAPLPEMPARAHSPNAMKNAASWPNYLARWAKTTGRWMRNKGELRRLIGKRLELKYAPDLRFRLDETFDQMDETRRLFAQEKVRRDVED